MIKTLVTAALFSASYATDCPTCDINSGTLKITLDDCSASYSTYNCKENAYGNCECDCDGHYGYDCKDFTIGGKTVVLGGTCSDDTRNPTSAPTASPTKAPTTKAPTKSPTNSPTTKAPTKSPTNSPTYSTYEKVHSKSLTGTHNGGDTISMVRLHSGSGDYRYNIHSLSAAETACANYGLDVCSPYEMENAQSQGWAVCSWMYRNDGTGGYPITQSYINAMTTPHSHCGGSTPGTRTNSAISQGNACCIDHTGSLDIVAGPTSEETWFQAQLKCSQMNPPRHLVEPRDAAANTQVNNLHSGSSWIGVTDYRHEGTFIITGAGNYKNWNTNEPNNSGGDEDCVEQYTSGKWNDLPCTGHSRAYTCELPKYTGLLGPSTILNARTVCSKYNNGRIASPRNTAENTQLKNWGATLIGIDDQTTEGKFLIDGIRGRSYTNWNSGEPNDSGGEDCVQLRSDGKWNDVPCGNSASNNWRYVCEYDRHH